MHSFYTLDVAREPAISLSKAARLPEYTRDGHHSSPVTVWRHIRKGVRRHDGTRIYLESAMQGGRYVTTREAVRRFHERLSIRGTDPAAPLPSVAAEAHASATKRLEMAGL